MRTRHARVRAPHLVLPTDNVRIIAVAARLPVTPIADDVRIVAMLSGILVNERMPPRIVANLFVGIRPLPVLDPIRLDTQRLKPLLTGRINTGIQLVRTERCQVRIDLRLGRYPASPVALADHP